MKRVWVVSAFTVVLLTACATTPGTLQSPAASSTPLTATPTRTATPDPATPTAPSSESPAAVDVTFTFACGYFAADGTPTTIAEELLSFEDAWAHDPATAWCRPIQHGTVFTALQHEAVALAGDVLPDGIDQVGGLYAQCAMRDNGYLKLTALAPNQAQEVRGFLHICPDRPGAEYLRAMLGG